HGVYSTDERSSTRRRSFCAFEELTNTGASRGGQRPLSGLVVARVETALSLSFHILFAVFGVGLPWLVLYTERRWLKTGDRVWYALTRKWARVMAVLFAIGAVSGTVLSFEFGLLWPTFMATYGGAIGLMFTLEAFAFFAGGIFMGLYLYGCTG